MTVTVAITSTVAVAIKGLGCRAYGLGSPGSKLAGFWGFGVWGASGIVACSLRRLASSRMLKFRGSSLWGR